MYLGVGINLLSLLKILIDLIPLLYSVLILSRYKVPIDKYIFLIFTGNILREGEVKKSHI